MKTCAACGNEWPVLNRYCGHCGAALPLEPTTTDPLRARPSVDDQGARRLVTLLFADLTNYTRTASRVDPEAVYYAVRDLFERLARAVRRQDGYIDRYVGDGFLATFGLPEAHEDDPARALSAALEMQQIVAELRSKASHDLDWELELRVGINTGPVIRGRIDTGSWVDATVFGHAVNLADRLQEAARPGTILVSEAVHRLTRAQFSFSAPVRLQLKGIDRPVTGFELVGRRLHALPRRGLTGRKTELVGRHDEFEELSNYLQRLQVGQNGMIALVTGPAGIGKTRLVEDVLVQSGGHLQVVRTGCFPTQGDGYSLLTQLLEDLCRATVDDPSSPGEAGLDDFLSTLGAMAEEVGPALQFLIGSQRWVEPRADDPQQQQRRILAAVRRIFAWMARRRPTVVVLDDLQWADQSSLAVLTHCSDLVAEVPLAIIAIARSEALRELDSTFVKPDTTHQLALCDIRLEPLRPEESELLVTLLLPTVTLPPPLSGSIADRGGGIPLLIEELVRMLLDEGVFRRSADGWQIADGWAEVVQKVPDTVNGLILGRYDRLPAGLKQLLTQASVLGHSFSLPLLAEMTSSTESELREHLKSLEESDYVQRVVGGTVPVFFFRHALMQEAIYQTLLRSESRTLHLRAADAIQKKADNLVNAASLIGHHLEKASSPHALPYLMRAASHAAARYANQEAIDLYHRAQALLNLDRRDHELAVDIALGLADVLARVNRFEEAHEALQDARRLSAVRESYRLGDVQFQLGLVYAAQGDHAGAATAFRSAADLLNSAPAGYTLSDIEREMGWVLCRQGKLSEARARAEAALALALSQSNLRAVASAYNLLTPVHYWAGQLPEAVTSGHEALVIRDQLGDIWGSASSQTNLASLYFRLGKWDEAESLLRQSVFVRQEIGDHQGVVLSSSILGLLLLEACRYDEARDWLEQAFATLQKRSASPDVASQLYGNRGLLRLRTGELELARQDLDRCLTHATQAENNDLRALALAYLAETQLAADEPDSAEELLDAAASSAAKGSPEVRAEYLRARSLWCKSRHAWPDALEANRQAIALYREIGNRYEVAHLQLEAAEIQLARCQVEPSSAPEPALTADLQDALRTFRELPAAGLVARAEETLSRARVCFGPAVVPALPEVERPVVVVHLGFHGPAGQCQDAAVAGATRERLAAELARLARPAGATAIADSSSVVYLLGDGEPGPPQLVAQQAVTLARTALETADHLNRASLRQQDVAIPVTAGIAAEIWEGRLANGALAATHLRRSVAGRRAAALAATPEANAILLSGDVAEQVREIYSVAATELESGGPAFRLGRARPEVGVPQALPGASPRFIGRQTEVDSLRRWIDRMRTDSRGLVCYMEAEAGMGKSRLVEEVLAYAQPGICCLQGKCESFRSSISYWPLIDLLGQGHYHEGEAGRRLKSLLGLRPADEPDEALIGNLAPADLRRELFGRLRAFLLEQAGTQPVLLVFEDVHCIDLASLELIDYLFSLTFQAPVSLMMVARAEMPGPHRAMVGRAERVCRDTFLRISFASLTESESTALIRELLETAELPDGLWPRMRPFAGHPLSLEEALRFLVERQWLWRSNGRWRLARAGDRPDRTVPVNFRDLVLGRLDTLDKQTLHLFQAAAVLGEEVDLTVLGRIVPDQVLLRRLSELVERGWLFAPTPERPTVYRFKHTLTRETVYGTLMTSKRRLVHQRAAEAIRALYREEEEEHLELLAHHFAESSLREEALHYSLRAAEKSAARYALAESFGYYTRSEQLLSSLPDLRYQMLPRIALGLAHVHLLRGEPANAASRAGSLIEEAGIDLAPETRAVALRHLAEARREMGEFSAALDRYQEGLAALSRVTQPEQNVESEHWTIQLGIARTYLDMRENRRAREKTEQIVSTIDRQAHPRLIAEAYSLLGGVAHRQGDIQTARQMVHQSLETNRRIGNRSGVAADYSNLGILAALRQAAEEANHFFSLGLEISEELGDSRGVGITLNNLGQLAQNEGRSGEAIDLLERAASAARRSDLTQVLAQSLSNLGQARAHSGRIDQALDSLNEAESLCERHGFRNLLCEVQWKKADALGDGGDLVAAETTALASRTLAVELGSRDLTCEAQRALARVYRRRNRLAAALNEANAAWQARSGHPDTLARSRFAAEYALALLASGLTGQARLLLWEEVARSTVHESPTVMQEIEEALERVGTPDG